MKRVDRIAVHATIALVSAVIVGTTTDQAAKACHGAAAVLAVASLVSDRNP